MESNALKWDPSGKTKQVGARIHIDLWEHVKIQAIREGRRTGQILDDAIRLYLDRNGKNGVLGWRRLKISN